MLFDRITTESKRIELEDLKHEQFAIWLYLKHHQSKVNNVDQLLTNPFLHLLLSDQTSTSKELLAWAHAPYKGIQNILNN